MPNSLIFAVILAVWAAYLIQHWIRRRDHVATAKSVDRFSEAMRVLERRQRMPRADVTPPAPRSYSLSLTRPAHPDVVVKRARPGVSAEAPRRAARRLRKPSAAVVRATLLLLGVLALAAGVTLSVTGRAPWWATAAGVGGLVLALALVRWSVARQRRRAASPVRAQAERSQSSRQARRPQPARAESARPKSARTQPVRPQAVRSEKAEDRATRPAWRRRRGPATPARTARKAPASAARRSQAVHEVAQTAQVVAAAPAPEEQRVSAHEVAAREVPVPSGPVEIYDVAAFDAPTAPPVAEPVPGPADQEAAPEGTWVPVAVPPPTYTLKARATRRPAGAPAESTEQSGPVLVGTEDVEGLPFDGNAMAFDEEFEDLPPVHFVG